MYKLELSWKEFNIDLRAIDTKMRQDYVSYVGNQAHAQLELWFSEEPSQEDKDAIELYWNNLSTESDEAESYQSMEDLAADKAIKVASGRAKLAALGLTEEEIDALLG